MATFPRPTFTELLQQVQSDFNTRLPGADATLRYSVLNVISYVIAGVTHGLYGFDSWIALQGFPDTAENENLRRWGSIWQVLPLASTPATGNVDVTGIDATVVPIGTELRRSDGIIYETTEEVTIASGVGSLPVVAQTSGLTTNATVGTVLTFVSPIANVSSTGTVDSDEFTGGADEEEDDSYLQRVLARIGNPPHGGAFNDYVKWALEVPGVTRAWVYPKELGIGQVSVRFMMDGTYDDGIPIAGDVTTVQNYIEIYRPVTAELNVYAPAAHEIDFTIELNVSDTAAIRESVEANLREMIVRDSEPGGTIYLSRINEAISLATGEFDHIVTIPAANVTPASGEIATMGDITWV